MAVGRIHTTRHAVRVAAVSAITLTATLLTVSPAQAAMARRQASVASSCPAPSKTSRSAGCWYVNG